MSILKIINDETSKKVELKNLYSINKEKMELFFNNYIQLCYNKIDKEREALEKSFDNEQFDSMINYYLYNRFNKKFINTALHKEELLENVKKYHNAVTDIENSDRYKNSGILSYAELRLMRTIMKYYTDIISSEPKMNVTNETRNLSDIKFSKDISTYLIQILLNILIEYELYRSRYNKEYFKKGVSTTTDYIASLKDTIFLNTLPLENHNIYLNTVMILDHLIKIEIDNWFRNEELKIKYGYQYNTSEDNNVYKYILSLICSKEYIDITISVIDEWNKEITKLTAEPEIKVETKTNTEDLKNISKEDLEHEIADNILMMTGLISSKTNFNWSDIKENVIEILKKV